MKKTTKYTKVINTVINRTIAHVKKLEQFQQLSEANKKKVISALLSGRPFLSDGVNGSDKIDGLHFTTNHSGKMKTLTSLSTSVLANPICEARRKDKTSICAFCFSVAQHKTYTNMKKCFSKNLDILRAVIIDKKHTPVILPKSLQFRIESFGDCCSVTQAINYLNICALNPWLKCAIWTKNLVFYHRALNSGKAQKGSNTNIIYSSRKVNKLETVPEQYKYFIDRVFTVYSEDFITANNININCGANSCATCKRCYIKTRKLYEIREKLK